MTSLAPTATYHAELREQLDGVGQVLGVQRALRWASRGLVAGVGLDLMLVAWLWSQGRVAALPFVWLVALPLGAMVLAAVASLFVRSSHHQLARQVDHAVGLQERAITALELGRRGVDHPLAVAQMRDTVEHLKRVDHMEAFPLRAPTRELGTAAIVGIATLVLAVAPNPLLREQARNPISEVIQEQAQKVDRLAGSMEDEDLAALQQLREILKSGAVTLDSRSESPDEAITALDDMDQQIRSMSATDDQLAAALAAISSALSNNASTSNLSQAINTGDLHEVSRAAHQLGEQADQLSGSERALLAKVLEEAAALANRASPSTAGQLEDAASALAGMQSGAEGQMGEQSADGQQSTSGAQGQSGGRSASEALGDLADDAGAAAERQRAEDQIQASRNAIERAMGQRQSRSVGSPSRANSQSLGAEGGEGMEGEGMGGEGQGDMGGEGGMGAGEGEDPGGTSGAGTGSLENAGDSPGITTLGRTEQDSDGGTSPDETSDNPYLGDALNGEALASLQNVNPNYSNSGTQGGDSNTIPLGLRDLVKDYFSSIDQK